MTFLKAAVICIPEVFILCNIRGREFMNREFMIHLFVDVFK